MRGFPRLTRLPRRGMAFPQAASVWRRVPASGRGWGVAEGGISLGRSSRAKQDGSGGAAAGGQPGHHGTTGLLV